MVEPDVKVRFADYRSGQFAFMLALGIGDTPLGFASGPASGDMLEFSIAKVWGVTPALNSLEIAEFLEDYL